MTKKIELTKAEIALIKKFRKATKAVVKNTTNMDYDLAESVMTEMAGNNIEVNSYKLSD